MAADSKPQASQTGGSRSWLDMGPRAFDAEAGPEADYQQDALFPEPDPCGTTDLLS
ncbi:hypothetical protein [Actinomadura sp. WMMA1423]|uniref:hypothetical protein n=1 Tax=Actinomadura sp. WMMA1423 TaxID=2591108 RepID=UPI00143D2174|nr:hypothetical protein [Actinomadura sp. WMMA1423]